MNFYSYSYLVQQNSNYKTVQWIIIAVVLVAVSLAGVMWYRHRSDLKYRDLLTIMTLILVFLIGLQVNEWRDLKSSSAQKSQATQIMQQVAKDKNMAVTKIWSNTANVNSGMLIIVKSKIYTVTVNADGSSFTLSEAKLINPQINYIGGK
ncbi:DUF3290 domain-containing protein [Lapidilactobacillus gannanensis]|uniref:DUF3290 domain-containing protein n=1 Tax=Lapidilactobacillus gannanensis TaxID=2486002 RepID=A0ABW4BLV6_9LACO|nr:DUF3290 domain-containing protein [Lapidilactobacillus gannanensis]